MTFSANHNLADVGLLGEALRRAVTEFPAYSSMQAPPDTADADEIIRTLKRLPVSTKDHLRADLTSFISTAYDPKKLQEVFTGGSSGSPLRLLRSKHELALERSFVERAWSPFSLKPDDRIVVLRARSDPRSADGIKYIDNKGVAWVAIFDLEDAAMNRVLDEVIALRPALIRGYGSLVARLLAHSAKVGKPITSLKGAAYSSDEMAPHERAFIRNELGLKLISLYGQTERACMATSDTYSDLHTCFDDYGFVELLRPDGTAIESPGEQGEIVATSLFPRATAMIRYRTGDISSWAASDGHTSTRQLDGIDGRSGDILVDRDGRRVAFSRDVKDSVLKRLPVDARIQFFQDRPGDLIVKINCGRRADITSAVEGLDIIATRFKIVVEWNSKLYQAPNGKTQLFVVHK